MKRIIITGETGSGKTYNAITENDNFIYIAPCRQLVYESFIEYAKDNDILSTGETYIAGNGNFFGVYESCTTEIIDKYETIIVDEAHFVNDEQRGFHLNILIKYAENNNKNIILLTATDSINRTYFKKYKNIHLESKFSVPQKIQIKYPQFWDNVKAGMSSIVFCASINEAEWLADDLCRQGIKTASITSNTLPDERLNKQYKFKRGEITCVCTTNVLAQGLNFPAENILINYDMWSTEETYQQKLGRLGRPFLSKSKEVYYCLDGMSIPKKLKKKKPQKEKRTDNYLFSTNLFENKKEKYKIENERYYIYMNGTNVISSSFEKFEMIEDFYYLNYYSNIKYAKRFLNFVKNSGQMNPDAKDYIERAFNILNDISSRINNVIFKLKSQK